MRYLLLVGMIVFSIIAIHAQDSTPTLIDPCERFYNGGDTSLPFLMAQGDVRLGQGNNGDAIVLYTCVLERDGAFLDAYIRRGTAYAAQGNFELALEDYSIVLEFDSADIRAYLNRGVVYMSQGRFGLALGDFDIATALDPGNVIANNNRAVLHAAEAHYDLALGEIEQALSLDPKNPYLYATRAMIYSGLANDSYAQFRAIAGGEARYPAGEPSIVMNAIRDARITETFNVWIPALIRAE